MNSFLFSLSNIEKFTQMSKTVSIGRSYDNNNGPIFGDSGLWNMRICNKANLDSNSIFQIKNKNYFHPGYVNNNKDLL